MRPHASVLHLDLDAFFAAVEQRDKPSLRGKPVVVGGVGGRGVVATASYEARRYGVRSAMSTREARSRCPHAAFLTGRFLAYREASEQVMRLLRATSPLVEPLSLDEAFVDLARADLPDLEVPTVTALAERLRASVSDATGGLSASVGIATSKFVAKVASDLDKPDGLVVVPPGTERDLLRPMHVSVIPGVGPASAERLRRAGIHTVAELETVGEDELVRLLGRAHGTGLFRLARAEDDRPVVAEREAKSVSVEGTYDTDLTDRALMESLLTRQAGEVAARLAKAGLSGRTVTIKVRLHDFTTLNRSTTLPSPTDSAAVVGRLARGLLAELMAASDLSGGVRLLGVGVSGLADWVQEDLFGEVGVPGAEDDEPPAPVAVPQRGPTWPPGADVVHADHGRGWVWGSGRGVVTVRFETAHTPPGPVRSFAVDDPALSRWPPKTEGADEASGSSVPAVPLEIRPLDLADDDLMAVAYDLSRRADVAGRDDPPYPTAGAWTAGLRHPESGERQVVLGGWYDDRLAAVATLWLPLLDNLDKAWFHVTVDPDRARRGVGRAMVEEVASQAAAADRSLLLAGARVPHGATDHPRQAFARACGFEVANVEVVRQLPLPVADADLERWAAQAAERASGYALHTFADRVPDDLVESLCVLLGQLAVDAPTGTVDFEEEVMTPERYASWRGSVAAQGRRIYETVALTPDRTVAAQSTLVAYADGSSPEVEQWGTFVHREHRGHRLGLAVKVANLAALQAAQPGLRRVTTQNAETNAWMIAINEQLGFVPVEDSVELSRRL